MPGQYLTLDIQANDQATPILKSVGQQSAQLEAQLEALLRTSSRLAGSERESIRTLKDYAKAQEEVALYARRDVEAQTKLIQAQAQLVGSMASLRRELRMGSEEYKAQLAQKTQLQRQQQEATQAARAEARAQREQAKAAREAAREVSQAARAEAKAQREAAQAAREAAKAQAVLRREKEALANTTGAAASRLGPFSGALARGNSASIALHGGVSALLTGMVALDRVAALATRSVELQAEAMLSAIQSSLRFEQEIARVAAVTGGAAGSFDTLRGAALEGGAATLYTAQQAGEGLRFLAQAGLTASQAARALPSSLQLAAAGVLDLARAADISTNIMSGYKFEVSELGRVNDVLVKASTSSNTNVQELGVAFSYVAGVASSTKQEFEDITALLEVLANNGIKGSKSGRALANAISRIEKPTAEGRAVLADLNVSLTDAQGRTKNLVTVLKEFESQGASTAQVLSFFGEVAGRSLVTVLNSGTKSVDKFAQANRTATGAAAEFQRKLQDTASAQLQIFQSTIETAAITIGTHFNPNIKEGAKLLTEQVQALLKNNEVLDQFDVLANDGAKALTSLLYVGAEVVPMMIELSGVTLEMVKASRLLYKSAELAGRGLVLLSGGGSDLLALGENVREVMDAASGASDGLGDSLDATSKLSAQARERLLAAAKGMGTVEVETTALGRGLDALQGHYKGFLGAIGLNKEDALANRNRTLAETVNILTNAYIGFERRIKAANAALDEREGRGEYTLDPKLEAARLEAELEAQIAGERNEAAKAELEYELEIFKLRQQGLDLDIQGYKIKAATSKLEQRLEEIERRKRSAKGRTSKVDLASLLAQEELTRRLIVTEDERAKIQLRYEQALLRIKSSKDAESLKAAKQATAEAERDQALTKLAIQEADKLRAAQVEALRLRASMVAESDKLLSIELERQAALAELAGQTIPDELRTTKEQAISQKAITEAAKARRDILSQTAARQVAYLRSEAALLGGAKSTQQQIAAIELERQARIEEINASEVEQRTKINQLALVEKETAEKTAEIRRQGQLAEAARLSALQQGIAAGVGADVSGILGQASNERQAALTQEIEQLRAQQQRDGQAGADTTLLERRITLLQQEAEAERANLELQKQRIQATEAATSSLTQLVLKGAEVAALGFKGAEAYEAMGAAVSATAGLGGALATALNLPARQAAKLQAAFNAAAAIAAGAAYAASGFTALNLLQAAVSHGIAAAKFGIIAGTGASSGSAIPRGSAGASASGASTGSASVDMARERERTAAAFARALRDELSRPTQATFNIDFGSSVQLQQAPDVARQLQRTLGQSAATLYQSSALVRSAG